MSRVFVHAIVLRDFIFKHLQWNDDEEEEEEEEDDNDDDEDDDYVEREYLPI